MDFSTMGQVAVAMITQVGLRILGAIILWVIGRMIISVIVRLVSRSLTMRHVDATTRPSPGISATSWASS